VVASATWSFAAAVDLHRAYQDSWVLEGVWLPVGISLGAYVVCAVRLRRPRHVALLAATLAILVNAVPALKYAYPYAPTSDTADHVNLMRVLATTGSISPDASYQDTPGLHLVVAALTVWTGSPLWLWARLLPSLLGGLLPLGYYVLCSRLALPGTLTRCVLALSPFAVPVLYALNGTSFTATLLVALLVLLLVRDGEMDRTSRGTCLWEAGHTVLLFLLAGAILFWHPLSSLLYPLVLLAVGTFGQLRAVCRRACAALGALVSLGASMSAAAVVYWAFRAEYVWQRLRRNLWLVLQPGDTPALVPSRLSELDLTGRARIALFYHGRDAVLLALACGGMLLLAVALVRSLASRRATRPGRDTIVYGAAKRAFHTYSLVWLFFGAVICALFAWRYGAQGYRRFLLYVVTLSPLPAGYAVWRTGAMLLNAPRWTGWPRGRTREQAARRVLFVALGTVAVLSCAQLHPYQPAVPSFGVDSKETTPVVWLHGVNSEYQRQLLRYADAELPLEIQLVIDYAGHRQACLFVGTMLQRRLRRPGQARHAPAFLLLHWPGRAGPYMEQAEFRSAQALRAWRDRPGVSTVYDNGGSFILYHPANGIDPFYLEQRGE
jgi:hypothetical protein